MTAIQDPYPADLDDIPFNPPGTLLGVTSDNALVAAVNRLAQAVEQNTLALLDNAVAASSRAHQPVQNAPQGLAPLPPVVAPVQVVAGRPPCPYHGIERVAPSTNGKGGFYCQAKPGIGQPNTNPKGYCTWHT